MCLEAGRGLGENTALGVICVCTCGSCIHKPVGRQHVGLDLQCRGARVGGVRSQRRGASKVGGNPD